jgi:transcription initiation factor TFIIH subunit 4
MATGLAAGKEMETHLTVTSDFVENEDGGPKGYIIVETNFRVYAYTNSPLQIAILSLFIEMHSQFVNMVVGVINRDSIRVALSRGITADQVEWFYSDYIIFTLTCPSRNEKISTFRFI